MKYVHFVDNIEIIAIVAHSLPVEGAAERKTKLGPMSSGSRYSWIAESTLVPAAAAVAFVLCCL